MASVVFTGIVRKIASGVILSFPDVPAISVEGATWVEAVEAGRIALSEYVGQCVREGKDVPLPAPDFAERKSPNEVARFSFPIDLPFEPIEVRLLLDPRTIRKIDYFTANRPRFLKLAVSALLKAFPDNPLQFAKRSAERHRRPFDQAAALKAGAISQKAPENRTPASTSS
jgi:hypothetical protein